VRLLALLLLSVCAAACGNPPATATATAAPPSPTPLLNPFPNADIPMAQAPADLQRVWRPYGVTIVPARHVPDSAPPAPHVTNATGGLVRDADAKHWATAFFRTRAWVKWAAAHAQGAFIRHIDMNMATFEFDSGSTETLPDCAIYPTAMVLRIDAGHGNRGERTQFAFQNTYTGPCTAVFNHPDGTQSKSFTVDSTVSIEHLGAEVTDPLLGDGWLDAQVINCTTAYCNALPNPIPAPVAVPGLPDVVTPMSKASAALRVPWTPYEVTVIASKTLLTDIPPLPPLTNNTGGVIDGPTAEAWERGFMLEAAWATFAWDNLQTDFQQHVAGSRYYNVDTKLQDAAKKGGRPALLPCALFPTQLTLQPISAKEQTEVTFADRTQYEFSAQFQRPCAVQISYADGSTGSVELPGPLNFYGEMREDPLLGEIWFSGTVAEPLDSP
jgi:hypothetical protein